MAEFRGQSSYLLSRGPYTLGPTDIDRNAGIYACHLFGVDPDRVREVRHFFDHRTYLHRFEFVGMITSTDDPLRSPHFIDPWEFEVGIVQSWAKRSMPVLLATVEITPVELEAMLA